MKKLIIISVATICCCILSSWTLNYPAHSLKGGLDCVFDEIFTQSQYKTEETPQQMNRDTLSQIYNYFNVLDSVYQREIGDTIYIEYSSKADGTPAFWMWNKKRTSHFISREGYIVKIPFPPYFKDDKVQKEMINMDSISLRKEHHKGRASKILSPSKTYHLIRVVADKHGLRFEGFKF